MFGGKQNLNVEFGGIKVKDVATKIGRVVGGEKGAEIGKKIDEATKNVTIKFEKPSDDDIFKIW